MHHAALLQCITLLCKTLAAAWHRCSSQKQIFRRIHATTRRCIGSHHRLACCSAHDPSCLQRCKSRIKSEKSLFVLFLCLLVQWASPKPNLLHLRPHSLPKQALRRSIKCLAKESEQLRCRSVATRSACSVSVRNSRAPSREFVISDFSVSPATSPAASPHGSRSPSPVNSADSLLEPTSFIWHGSAKSVFVTGSFSGWSEKTPLSLEGETWSVYMPLAPGSYQFKFIVDGVWKHSPELAKESDVNGNTRNSCVFSCFRLFLSAHALLGNINNVIEVKSRSHVRPKSEEVQPETPPGEYSNIIPDNLGNSRDPPPLPPHLKKALLNTAPLDDDPDLLPLPHRVMLKHLYTLPKAEDNVLIFGTTERYKSKFVTTVFYKPMNMMQQQNMNSNDSAEVSAQ
jgi:5'-AMP-activated protein kinase regulatory beta subunit